mmetsp:Transcript_20381/g.48464  ORF Transcript_20381/g.48464 Transcript_20381/m.48464 type:complete len:214 (-) Transcript_20381:168-809(-)|eukprot:CAMPEP_0113469210 /NCGR_PEP_ID=MMETSP0014_2-20120614/15776_1 /TAXON_ID=2857 /ORGANISM="Nitzschia sp." /LENGTH=213 /DNA_ID=CAMNT_0000361669 /DNA_START=1259 /DNA_END=1900 /DNA_ORIENTATION=+ /assembly_acc=CAM_ASM_000159
MTGSEILNIVVTVGISQLCIDLLSNYFVYKGENYQRVCRRLESATSKLHRAEAELKKNPNKHQKKYDRTKAEYDHAAAEVAKKHMPPAVWGGLYFFILLRILGAEHTGKVIGVLPFVPYDLVRRMTGRGLDWTNVAISDDESIGTQLDKKQAISFLCIYILSTISVKGYVHKMVGRKPPKGADNGFMTVAESPMVKRTLASVGIDVDELKKME